MIDWTGVQRALTRVGYPCGKADGHDGGLTYTALFAFAAGRQQDATLQVIGRAAAASWLHGDAITQTPARWAEFIAQTANETGSYTRLEEDLRYSAGSM